MTNQEELAELIGDEGYTPFRACSINAEKYYSKPKPPDKLIEIAEGRWLEKHYYGEIETSRSSNGLAAEHSVQPFYCKWQEDFRAEDGDEVRVTATGATEQEARMACAMAGLERLQQEKEKEDG